MGVLSPGYEMQGHHFGYEEKKKGIILAMTGSNSLNRKWKGINLVMRWSNSLNTKSKGIILAMRGQIT